MAVLHPYHAALVELLQTQPAKGRGHHWLFRVALHLRHYHTEEACFRFLRACADQWKDRQVPDEEIRKSVRKAYAEPLQTPQPAVQWPESSPSAISRVVSDTKPLFALEPLDMSAQRLLPALFAYDELVCAGQAQAQGTTQPLREILNSVGHCQYIVPSPMTSPTGLNQEGRESFRCLANTGPRRFLVVEGDAIDKEAQVRVLSHLAEVLTLILVVDSGGKSLHGWFAVAGQSETRLRAFMAYAVHLGADPHTWARCQWVRMPGGTRYAADGSCRPQPILFAHEDIHAEVA